MFGEGALSAAFVLYTRNWNQRNEKKTELIRSKVLSI
jgi:peptidoglycan biosynthesis protein MviN/MurJ (putative lipid II flippase)